ncbi:MAG: type II secretion system GspH family protein [Bryobacterales bacterium]|jgi:type II secretion system protein I|nr:type II secretion system GspH family protein [Bryobacterales bacterium]
MKRRSHVPVKGRRQRGFTLLEAMVATLIMAIAVVGLLSNISTSLNNASRLADYDQAALLAKRQMEQLMSMPLQPGQPYSGTFPRTSDTDLQAGWQARVEPFEANPTGMGAVLDRIVLQVWWIRNGQRRVMELETLKAVIPTDGVGAGRVPNG